VARPETSDLVLVYGTLRKGQPLHGRLKSGPLEYLGKATIRARLYDLGEYPGAVPSKSKKETVEGELYRMLDSAEQIRRLDTVEGCDTEHPERSLFVRSIVEAETEDGEDVDTWVYFLAKEPENGRRIESGRYQGTGTPVRDAGGMREP